MTGLLIVLLAWFLAGALVTAMIIWPACVIAGRVGRENADTEEGRWAWVVWRALLERANAR